MASLPNTQIPDLDRLPDVMEKLRMPMAARLMHRWLSSPALQMPGKSAATDFSDITMTWALSFGRVKDAYDYVVAFKIWKTAFAQRAIVKWLEKQNAFQNDVVRFGNVNTGLPQLHADVIQFYPVGSRWDTPDDMLGALGRFDFHFVVEGRTVPVRVVKKVVGHRVEIDKVGIYIRDSYDFQGNQELGYWDFDKIRMNKIFIPGGTPLNNSTFRAWRSKTGRGGDYIIFSDVRILERNPPDVFRTNR